MLMIRSHEAVTQSQFGPRAALYVTSALHASGADLDALEAIAAETRPARAVDLGCGGGHVAYRPAPHAGEVVACDLSADMLAEVAKTASFSTHHWRTLEPGLARGGAPRVGATALFIDSVSPGRTSSRKSRKRVRLLRHYTSDRSLAKAPPLGSAFLGGTELHRHPRSASDRFSTLAANHSLEVSTFFFPCLPFVPFSIILAFERRHDYVLLRCNAEVARF